MNRIVLLGVLTLGLFTFVAAKGKSGGTVHVSGYTTKSGKYVAPYYRSAPGSGSSSHSSGKGIPCGKSYISAKDVCHIGTDTDTGNGSETPEDSDTIEETVMPTIFETTTPLDYGFYICEEAFSAGFANIPLGDPSYHKELDKDGDGLACDSSDGNYTSSKSSGLPQGVVKGVSYATLDTLNAFGSIGVMADGSYKLSDGDRELTFTEGAKKTREGVVLEATPFMLGSVFFVPVSSLKLMGCKLTVASASASATCGDRSETGFKIRRW